MTEGYKKKVLFVGEASFLNTGFSTYYRELLPRLAACGKYEIAEFGSYASTNDPKVKSFINGRWKFYGNNPDTPEEHRAFSEMDPDQPGQNTNQFGKWRFDQVVADFKPDIVVDIRDWWMLAYQERSAFRKNFKWLVMPTVDSIPQKEEWINTYRTANYVMAYSDFGIDSLRKSHSSLEVRMDPPGKKGFVGVDKMPGKLHPVAMRPGVDLKTFKFCTQEDKAKLKEKWGIKPDIPIVLLVQRNQARKRISEVIRSFAMMKEKYPNDEFIQKCILVMHTAWPDNVTSIDFPRAIARIQTGYHGTPIKRKGIISEVCSTFMCHNSQCGDVFIAPSINLRQSHVIHCPKCGQRTARTPTTGAGLNREQLAEVYGMADMMVQMSIAEGCGMPVQEAKACGVPVLVTDYAAIAEKGKVPDYEHIDKSNYTVQLGGESMKVAYMYEEPETTCWRAMTSVEDCCDKMASIVRNRDQLIQMSLDARKCAELNYDWDKNWKEWEWILDHISISDRNQTWDKPIKLINITPKNPVDAATDEEFIVRCYTEILGYGGPAEIDEEGFRNWMAKLSYEKNHGVPVDKTRNEIANFFRSQAESLNHTEMLRANGMKQKPEVKSDDNNKESFEAMIV
jgi:glycosyltransferase involved in cell wall biosynthesis